MRIFSILSTRPGKHSQPRSHGDGATVNNTLEEGMADGIISSHEEDSLKEFDNQMHPDQRCATFCSLLR